MIQLEIIFVDVMQDGLVDIVISHTTALVPLTYRVLVFQQTIDQSVFVLATDGVLAVFYKVQSVNMVQMQPVTMVANVSLSMNMQHLKSSLFVFVQKDLVGKDVRSSIRRSSFHLIKTSVYLHRY